MAEGTWVRIPSPSTRQRWLLTFGSLAILSLFLWTPVGGLTRIVDEAVGPSPLIRVGLPIVLALAVLGIAYLIVAERTQPPAVDVARGVLRIGRKEWGFREITGARIELAGAEGDDTLILRFSTTGDESCSVVVSTREGVRLADEQRDALLAAIRGSRIAPPRSKDDPHGKFAHIEFPGHLTLEDAAALVDGSGTAEPMAARGQRGQGSGARNVHPADGTARALSARGPSRRAQYGVAVFVLLIGIGAAVIAIQHPGAVSGRRGIPVLGIALLMLPAGIAYVLIIRRDARRADAQRAAAAQEGADADEPSRPSDGS
ncbi:MULTISPECIES: hypothetical protein [Clavibacter]|uniref:PH domain-containing protein n=2 Tax=Clavibacter TaxID=1573 RepID=A0A399NV01_9MICO|nr:MULTISPECIES: hypothetical protein [Clavibacter]KDP92142.1 hypothetical protein W824_04145 [Clavibacter cf. michiganensis LMG 26808]RII97597.1 hypothetical protein DZF96_06695 [Clavibacter michiganensis]UKF24848.1 hypothetical protein KYT88_14200 [Clavibacter sp. A6099]